MRPLSVLALALAAPFAAAQPAPLTPAERQKRIDTEAELQSLAVVERKLMVPMRDGVRLATDVYRPKNAAGPVPIVFVRTPYNFNFWDVRNGVPADMTRPLEAVKRGYALVLQNERGHFFSEGHYDILGAPVSDGTDMLDWLKKQPWSNGKVGTTGCSSTAEYQMAIAAQGHPAYAAMNVQGFGAGVGRVAPYFEQGNWYRGGATQMLFIAWLYGEQNQVRPMFPQGHLAGGPRPRLEVLRPRAAAAAGRLGEGALAPAGAGHPEGGRRARTASSRTRRPARPAGAWSQRAPNDPAWYKGGLWHDDMKLDVPGLWFMSWYDVSIGPEPRDVQPRAQAREGRRRPSSSGRSSRPSRTARYTRATADTVVGERSMGDARLDYEEIVYGFFDKFLKGDKQTRLDTLPKVTYFTMGTNEWKTSDSWPPEGARERTFYLASGGRANSLCGDGALARAAPDARPAGQLQLRPDEPGAVAGRQRLLHRQRDRGGRLRPAPQRGARATCSSTPRSRSRRTPSSAGPIVPKLYVSSDARDTDFTVKVRRRRPRRDGLQPRRVDPAHALARGLRQAARLHAAGPGVRGDAAAAHDQQHLQGRPPAADRGLEQQLPALRPQPEHRRQQLRRGGGQGGAQRRAPLEALPVELDGDGREPSAGN